MKSEAKESAVKLATCFKNLNKLEKLSEIITKYGLETFKFWSSRDFMITKLDLLIDLTKKNIFLKMLSFEYLTGILNHAKI